LLSDDGAQTELFSPGYR